MNEKYNMIYSKSLEEKVISYFYLDDYVYVWNDDDQLYYNVDDKEDIYFAVPNSIKKEVEEL